MPFAYFFWMVGLFWWIVHDFISLFCLSIMKCRRQTKIMRREVYLAHSFPGWKCKERMQGLATVTPTLVVVSHGRWQWWGCMWDGEITSPNRMAGRDSAVTRLSQLGLQETSTRSVFPSKDRSSNDLRTSTSPSSIPLKYLSILPVWGPCL
jgi:hypothetical protein